MSRVVDADTCNLLNSMADSALYSHQVNLQSLQQQMDTYAGAMRGNPQFFQIKANAAEAVLLAEVYRSETNTIHATIVHPAATISHNTEAQHAQSEINTLEAPTRATTPAQVNVDTNTTLATLLPRCSWKRMNWKRVLLEKGAFGNRCFWKWLNWKMLVWKGCSKKRMNWKRVLLENGAFGNGCFWKWLDWKMVVRKIELEFLLLLK